MMMKRSTVSAATFLLAFAFLAGTISGYSVLPQRASYFVGRDVLAAATASTSSSPSAGASIEMKKGKANIPSHMRSQYARAQEMEGMRKQMMESTTVGSDGFPIFNLYVRTSLKNVSLNSPSLCLFVCC